MIVLGVTVLVAFQVLMLTLHFNFGIQALGFVAVAVVVIFGGATAVATVPSATAVVVFIIACFVSFPARFKTRFAARLDRSGERHQRCTSSGHENTDVGNDCLLRKHQQHS